MPTLTRFDLSDRELDILRLVAEGWTDRAIGRELGLSETTAKQSLHYLTARIGAHNRAHAVVIAFRAGVIR